MFEEYSILDNFKKFDFKTFLKKDLERTVLDLIIKPIHTYKSFLEKMNINNECKGMYNTQFYKAESIYDLFKQRARTEKAIQRILLR